MKMMVKELVRDWLQDNPELSELYVRSRVRDAESCDLLL